MLTFSHINNEFSRSVKTRFGKNHLPHDEIFNPQVMYHMLSLMYSFAVKYFIIS